MKDIALACLIWAAPLTTMAQELRDGTVIYKTDQSFDDLAFGLEMAIEGAGLVISGTNHVGAMLDRTKGAVGGTKDLFTQADVYSFCSSTLSREVMEADILNISFCPYDIFIYATPEAPDQAVIGYRTYPDGPMQKVQTMLDDIVKEAIGQ
jgi:hypothetical protein